MSKCMTEKAHIFDDYLDDLINNGNGQLDTKKYNLNLNKLK